MTTAQGLLGSSAMRKDLPPGIEPITADEARRLIHHTQEPELSALMARAKAVREAVHGDAVSLCGITNAKRAFRSEEAILCEGPGEAVREGPTEARQGLGRQLFGEKLDEQRVGVHAAIASCLHIGKPSASRDAKYA